MNDPHVSAIHYQLEFGEGVEYTPPADTLSFTRGDFDFAINGSDITVTPRVHFADRNSARTAAGPYVRAWEIDGAIRTINELLNEKRSVGPDMTLNLARYFGGHLLISGSVCSRTLTSTGRK